MSKGFAVAMPKLNLPYTIAEEISYDPAARDLSVEVAKAKATNADAILIVGRLNDAMLITGELVKQRWTPEAILSMGPGWYEDQYFKTLGKLSDGPISFVPWYDPNKKVSKMLIDALAKSNPGVNLNTNHVYTFEALLTAADAYKRAGSTDPKALAEALRGTNITDNASIGPGISFNAKGQNDKIIGGAIQNRGGKLITIAPKEAANGTPEWPMKPYQNRT
jgi:branched-chain amino acid transport system substrate-binding protein